MPIMSLDSLVEARIERGEFDNLPGQGRTLDHPDYAGRVADRAQRKPRGAG